jgi:hypothetical protein
MTRQVFAGVVAVLAILTFKAEADEKARTLPDLVRFLEREYHLSRTRLADYVTAWGLNINTHEAKVVRWSEGPLVIAILAKDVDLRLVDAFKVNMDKTAAAAGRSARYCTEVITGVGFDYKRPRCLDEIINVIAFIDGSPELSTEVMRSLTIEARGPTAERFWAKYADQPLAERSTTSCEGGFSIDPHLGEITSGRAYFRVIQQGSEDLRWANTCTSALPFLIFSQTPIWVSETEQTFITELLELNYAKELRSGMKRDEVLKILNEQPL